MLPKGQVNDGMGTPYGDFLSHGVTRTEFTDCK